MRIHFNQLSRLSIAGLIAVLFAAAVVAPPVTRAADTPAGADLHRAPARTHLLYRSESGVSCVTEDRALDRTGEPLHVIKSGRGDKVASGLTIVLRATNQLEQFPDAKATFLRAAGIWEAKIASQITVIIDVDFGPKRFGRPYEPLVIGSTDAQDLVSTGLYGTTRSALVARASNGLETTLYNALPTGTLPTDAGSGSTMVVSSANLRALGLINPVANPATETNFGDPPSVGFNSKFAYDFDPSNGIDSDKTDFEAVAVHEIGHVLGFESNVGLGELFPDAEGQFTVLDLFRFRPGVTLGSFTSSTRILSSGGTQVFFAGTGEIMCSTGRPDGTHGDGQQASHWKDDVETGVFIGIMDPTIGDGQREQLTASDILAFNSIGYRLASELPVTVDSATASLVGDELTLMAHGNSTAGPITGADVSVVDAGGTVLASAPRIGLSIGTSGNFTLTVTGLSGIPAAVACTLVLVDNSGNTSASNLISFAGADPGAPTISKFKVKNGKLTLTGQGFTSAIMLEVNGATVALPQGSTVKSTGMKCKINLAGLTTRSGPNRFRVLLGGLRSNIIVVTL